MATSWAGPATVRPPIDTLPSLAGMRPAMMRSSEDLPQPERPSSDTISLLRSFKVTSSRTSRFSPLPLG
jgi:hypothetical protein